MDERKERVRANIYKMADAEKKKKNILLAALTVFIFTAGTGVFISNGILKNNKMAKAGNEYDYYYFVDEEQTNYDYFLSFSKDGSEQNSYMEIIEQGTRFRSVNGL